MARLRGTMESKLVTLEQRKQDVPPQWLGVLAELGFRVPEWALGRLPNVSAAEADAAVTALLDENPKQTPSASAESAVRESGPGASLACMSVDDAMRIRAEADAAASAPETLSKSQAGNSDIATSTDAPTAGTEQQQRQQGEDGTPFCGHWLRERLQPKGIRPRDAVMHLATQSAVLSAIERLDIPLPQEWIPKLLTLGVFTAAE